MVRGPHPRRDYGLSSLWRTPAKGEQPLSTMQEGDTGWPGRLSPLWGGVGQEEDPVEIHRFPGRGCPGSGGHICPPIHPALADQSSSRRCSSLAHADGGHPASHGNADRDPQASDTHTDSDGDFHAGDHGHSHNNAYGHIFSIVGSNRDANGDTHPDSCVQIRGAATARTGRWGGIQR